MGVFKDMTGMVFGKLTVLERDDDYISPKGYHSAKWKCQCECGNLTSVRGIYLRRGTSLSCGCNRIENPNRLTHGESKSDLYRRYRGILSRCYNPNWAGYKNYGARGITVCDEWLKDPTSFIDWARKNGYSKELSIDRIDVNKGYSPDNCRWATNKEQQNNKTNNHMITYNGETKTMSQFADEFGVPYHRLKDRINRCGWDVEKALTTQ